MGRAGTLSITGSDHKRRWRRRNPREPLRSTPCGHDAARLPFGAGSKAGPPSLTAPSSRALFYSRGNSGDGRRTGPENSLSVIPMHVLGRKGASQVVRPRTWPSHPAKNSLSLP
jgi:hypothetical protein